MKNLKVLFIVLCVACATAVWGEDFTTSYSYGTFTDWSLTNYDDKSSYYLVPNGTSPSVATISGIFTNRTITSDVVITINCATYGNGTNPSANSFSVYAEDGCTTSITATQGGTLPTSSTYTDVVYTVNEHNTTKLTKDLVIKITKPGKHIRLKSIKVVFSYTDSSGSTETTVSYNANTGDSYTGTLPTDEKTYANGDNITISDTRLTRTGYTHIGWNTDKNATEALNSLTATGSAITLYAIWKVNTYTITWKVSSENYNAGNPTTSVEHGKSVSELPTEPSVPSGCSGKVFVGWTDKQISTGTDIKPDPLFKTAAEAPKVTKDTTYYAVFADENGE